MSARLQWSRVGGTLVLAFAVASRAGAQEALDVDRYVEIVLRTHPAAAQSADMELAASAERKVSRVFPDPTFEYSRDGARPPATTRPRATETSYSVSQTIPWPGTFRSGRRAGDLAADVLRAGAEGLRWELAVRARQAFAQLAAARALLEVARTAEADARSLLDLVSRRADLGESRESDRIKARVEWLRQQRNLAAAEREAEASEAIVRAVAVEPLSQPLVIRPVVHEPLPPLKPEELSAQIVDGSPRLRAAQAEAARQQALLSVAHRARIPDLGVTVFRQNELDKEATGFSIGVKVPLWNANRGEIARAEANGRISNAEVARVRIELVTEVQTRLKELQIAGDQVGSLEPGDPARGAEQHGSRPTEL